VRPRPEKFFEAEARESEAEAEAREIFRGRG